MAITAHLVVDGAAKAVEFYKAALGAEEVFRAPAEDGTRLMHAHLTVDGGKLFLCDDFPEYCGGKVRAATKLGASPVTLHLEVPDCDAAIDRAAAAGATVTMPAADMFWGDRYGKIVDPFGHEWSFSTPIAKAA
jgi:PhnB protein